MVDALMVVSCAVDADLRAAVAGGSRPRPEFLLLEEIHGFTLLDWSQLRGPVARRSGRTSLDHAREAVRRMEQHGLLFTDGEHVGLPAGLGMIASGRRRPHLMLGHHLTAGAKRPLLRLLGRRSGISRVLTHSLQQIEGGRRLMGRRGPEFAYIPYAVDLEFWRPDGGAEEALVLSPGREHRDHATLAAALATVDARVFVTGASAHSQAAHSVGPAGWPANFESGRVTYPALRDLYSRASVVVVPLLPCDFPAGITAVLEAMAMGKAVVVTGNRDHAQMFEPGRHALLVPPGDPDALRAAVAGLLADPDRRAEIGHHARALAAERHGLEAYAERLALHAGQLLHRGSRAGTRPPRTRSKPRLLLVSPSLPYPRHWGFAVRVYEMIRHLSATHRVTLLAYGGPEARAAAAPLALMCEDIRLVPEPSRPGRKRLRQAASILGRASYQLLAHHSALMQSEIDRLLATGAFDVVQVESSQMACFEFATPATLVLDEHNLEYELLDRMARAERSRLRRAYNRLEAAKFKAEELSAWKRFDLCVVTSDRERAILQAHLPGKLVLVVPNGVDLEHFQPGAVEEDLDGVADELVFTGALNYRPNADAVRFFVREVLPLVVQVRAQVHCTIVGDATPADVAELDGPHVTVAGRVADVRPLLRRAAVVIVPIRMGSGTRLKVLEALGMGRPMVTTSAGCEGIRLEPGRHALVADTAETFAAAVVRLLEDRALAAGLGRNGRLLATQRYGWANTLGPLPDALAGPAREVPLEAL